MIVIAGEKMEFKMDNEDFINFGRGQNFNDEMPRVLKVILRKLVSQLPENEKSAVILKFWDNKNIEDIATELRVRKTTAQKFLDSALKKIRSEFFNHFLNKNSVN